METVSNDSRPAALDHTQSSESIIPPAQTRTASTDNSVGDHGTAQQTTGSSPTDGARDATTNRTPGYDEIEQMTQERLEQDPEYLELKQKWDTWHGVEDDFALIESHAGALFWKGDGTVTIQELRVLADDGLADPTARDAAKRLLSDMSIWNELAKGDGRVGTHDVTEFVARMKSELKMMKDNTRAAINAELAPTAPPSSSSQQPAAGSAQGQGEGASTASASDVSGPLFKAPTPSTKGGMEGAVENVGNTLNAISDATNDVMAQLANPNLSPADKQKLQTRYNELQQLQQMLTSMYAQLQQNISNLMKMYSDVAKNSIQNMR